MAWPSCTSVAIRSWVRLAFALTGDWSLAEELGQEAFVRAWRSWGTIRRK